MAHNNLVNQLLEFSHDGLAVISKDSKVVHNNFTALNWLPRVSPRDLFNAVLHSCYGSVGEFKWLDPSPFSDAVVLCAICSQDQTKVLVCIKAISGGGAPRYGYQVSQAAAVYVTCAMNNQPVTMAMVEAVKAAFNAQQPSQPVTDSQPLDAGQSPFFSRQFSPSSPSTPPNTAYNYQQPASRTTLNPTVSSYFKHVAPDATPQATPTASLQPGSTSAWSQLPGSQLSQPFPSSYDAPASPFDVKEYPVGTQHSQMDSESGSQDLSHLWQAQAQEQPRDLGNGQQEVVKSAPVSYTAKPQNSAVAGTTQAYLEHALETDDLGAYFFDLRGNASHWTANCQRILGFGANEQPGLAALERHMQAEDRKTVVAVIHAAINAGGSLDETFYFNKPSDKSLVAIRLTGKVLHDADSTPVAIAGLVKDVTLVQDTAEELKMESRLLDLKAKELNEFNLAITKELYEPVRNLWEQLTKLEQDLGPLISPAVAQQFDRLRAQSKRMQTVVGGITAYAETMLEESEAEWLDTESVVTAALQSASLSPNMKVSLPDVWPAFYQNSWRLKQVLMHLFRNATMHNNSTLPAIKISIQPHGGGLFFTISDNGEGMPEEVKAHIFELFYMGNPKANGLGIGLPLVQKLVSSMGGTISISSESQTGTVVTLDLPGQVGPPKPKVRQGS